ncbi:UDP-N-acetylenolpyruvoylglucosamine reductase [Bowdeniella nasicola]|uniref:UDP-N-acetylenolpyruvoylglucosamine reductase n=1 Tax=Bowdeniella nasicola TaxID=208480 RepID=A0A1Q5Q5P4_9ACTO|nr:UDP-N-acetylmuramate dehydrogenase [Bowdeniella nasicola]OKL55111.1 UDP-N-acetylenolpyruvoylglucosamine reductase [Bowdeniella nasicola]
MSCSVPDKGPAISVEPVASWAPRPTDQAPVRFSDLTTLRIGGEIGEYHEVDGAEELAAAVAATDEGGKKLLVIGGGSNLVAADAAFDGVVIRDTRQWIELEAEDGCGGAAVRVSAGQPWDAFVAHTIENGWMGVEALSGIPGTVGAAPVQNVGAYGQEVSGTISAVRVFDRLEKQRRLLTLAELGFGYRTSLLKRSLTDTEAGGGRTWGPTGRFVVLEVSFQMRLATLSEPVRYAELARTLGVELHDRAPAVDVRQAVLELRRSKGMVLDEADHDTWSAGSFFTNPIIEAAHADELPEGAPRYPVTDPTKVRSIGQEPPVVDGLVKTSAAWLINHAGFDKGYGMPGPAALSGKHALALTNRGEATGADIRELAATVQAGVREAFGIELVPEPIVL